jgi:hypothetical protein
MSKCYLIIPIATTPGRRVCIVRATISHQSVQICVAFTAPPVTLRVPPYALTMNSIYARFHPRSDCHGHRPSDRLRRTAAPSNRSVCATLRPPPALRPSRGASRWDGDARSAVRLSRGPTFRQRRAAGRMIRPIGLAHLLGTRRRRRRLASPADAERRSVDSLACAVAHPGGPGRDRLWQRRDQPLVIVPQDAQSRGAASQARLRRVREAVLALRPSWCSPAALVRRARCQCRRGAGRPRSARAAARRQSVRRRGGGAAARHRRSRGAAGRPRPVGGGLTPERCRCRRDRWRAGRLATVHTTPTRRPGHGAAITLTAVSGNALRSHPPRLIRRARHFFGVPCARAASQCRTGRAGLGTSVQL